MNKKVPVKCPGCGASLMVPPGHSTYPRHILSSTFFACPFSGKRINWAKVVREKKP